MTVAVKTNRQLRTKSNVSLACLATTDLVVGLVVQPLQIVHHSFMLKGEADIICGRLTKISTAITVRCVMASLNHFVVLGTERYIAIKHSFAYDNLVTEIRIAVASGLAWGVAITLPLEDFWSANIRKVARFVALAMQFIFHALVVHFNVSIYREVRRNEKQIIAIQVSREVKEKLLKNKKAFYCTIIVLLTIFLCYFQAAVVVILIYVMKDGIPLNVKYIMYYLLTLLPIMNSLFNPLIYAVRIRYFRVAFKTLLSRKTIALAEKPLKPNLFRLRQGGVEDTAAERGENRVNRDGEVLQRNKILNNGNNSRNLTRLLSKVGSTAMFR